MQGTYSRTYSGWQGRHMRFEGVQHLLLQSYAQLSGLVTELRLGGQRPHHEVGQPEAAGADVGHAGRLALHSKASRHTSHSLPWPECIRLASHLSLPTSCCGISKQR